jgi:hypothetical protein
VSRVVRHILGNGGLHNLTWCGRWTGLGPGAAAVGMVLVPEGDTASFLARIADDTMTRTALPYEVCAGCVEQMLDAREPEVALLRTLRDVGATTARAMAHRGQK